LKQWCHLKGINYPPQYFTDIQAAEELEDILNTLGDPRYSNWLNIRLLKRIVKLTNIPKARKLINAYEECLHSKKASEVKQFLGTRYINPDHASKVLAKVNGGNSEKLFVSKLMKYCEYLEDTILETSNGSVNIADFSDGCLTIKCIIPMYCLLHAYKMAERNYLRFRHLHIQYIEIEPFPKLFGLRLKPTKESLSSLSSSTSQCMSI